MVPDDGFTFLFFLLVNSGAFQSQGGRAKKVERRMIKMGGWGLKGSASQCQKFHTGFELPIRKQIPPSHHQSLTPQRYSRWVLGPGRDGPGQTGGQRVPVANIAVLPRVWAVTLET